MSAADRLFRAVLCLLVWSLPVVGNRIALSLVEASPEEGVNMFGLTVAETRAAQIGTIIGLATSVAVIILTRLGWLWLAVAVGILIVAALILIRLPESANPFPWGEVLFVSAPLIGGLVTKPPDK